VQQQLPSGTAGTPAEASNSRGQQQQAPTTAGASNIINSNNIRDYQQQNLNLKDSHFFPKPPCSVYDCQQQIFFPFKRYIS